MHGFKVPRFNIMLISKTTHLAALKTHRQKAIQISEEAIIFIFKRQF